MNASIELELKEFIAQHLLFAEGGYPLPEEASFLAEGVMDSTGIMELVDFVSNRYGFDIPLKDIVQENFDSITRVARYIRCRLAQPAPAPPAATCAAAPA